MSEPEDEAPITSAVNEENNQNDVEETIMAHDPASGAIPVIEGGDNATSTTAAEANNNETGEAVESGLKRGGFEVDDGGQSQKKMKIEDETPCSGPAGSSGEVEDVKPEVLPPDSTSPLPACGEGQVEPPDSGNLATAESAASESAAEGQSKETSAPPNDNNNADQPVEDGKGEATQPPPSAPAGSAPPQPPGGGMVPHQAQMGYPPASHQMMGGMMYGQYPAMYGQYPPTPHGYHPSQHSMMMGPPHAAHAAAPPPGTSQGAPPGHPPAQQPGQSHAGFYGGGGQTQPAPGSESTQQPAPMGTPPTANRPPAAVGTHPQGAFQHPSYMMHMPHMMHYGPPGMFFSNYHMHGAMMSPMMAQAAFAGSPNNPAVMNGAGRSQQQPYMQAPPPRSQGTPLSLSCDDEQLSEYQMLVRKQLEIFEAMPEDVESNTQGRKKQVVLGQVGIRCRHCAGFPLRQRGRGAVYYPAKLQGVYQAAQNMASSHLCESCQCIPPQLKQELRTLRDRRDTASGGKQYWADGARAMGLIETEEGLRLRRPEGGNAQSPS